MVRMVRDIAAMVAMLAFVVMLGLWSGAATGTF